MTSVDVYFSYGQAPGESGLRAVDGMREVYGIRRVTLNEKQRTVRVEYDASRLTEPVVLALLRRAGIDARDPAVPV
jgi:hypothetical protein